MRPINRKHCRVVVTLVALTWLPGSVLPRMARRTAADCERLGALRLSNTTLTVAEVISGRFAIPGSRDTIRDLPPVCRVAGEIQPTNDSHIAFEVWLPLENWNGKFAGVGNGGWAGTISYIPNDVPRTSTLDAQVRRGYAAASTNTGHAGSAVEARFAYGHPERVVDFGWRAVHEMTVAAKAVTQTFYGRAPDHAYWIGCSTGGRQGLMEAQRFPADYDGIIAGAPPINWLSLMTGGLMQSITAIGDSSRYLPPAARALLHDAVIKQCDALDGVRDSVLEDPRRCHFDPKTLQCESGEAPNANCLTATQVAAVTRIYFGADDPVRGRKLMPGFERGSENLWLGSAAPGRPNPTLVGFYEWLVFGDSTWNWRTFDLANPDDRDAWLAADRKLAPILNATDPDLRAFRRRGGKLIQYHGWSDAAIPPQFSIDYYENVLSGDVSAPRARASALTDVQQFYRLFVVPGMGHCVGGDGPTVFDLESALENWVQRGVAPDSVIATRRAPNGAPDRSRPLCPYPKTAAYKGKGDSNDAASFTCHG
jgi:feruloyl esterase